MGFNWNKFVSTNSTILILVSFNIISLITFTLLYYLCERNISQSFKKSDNPSSIEIIDHFLLSVAVQSGVGLCSITPNNNIAKLLVALQEFFVMSSSFVSIYLFIYFTKEFF